MKSSNEARLRDALLGKRIKDVVYHNSHGLVIDLILDDGTKLSVCTYDDKTFRYSDEFYVGLNNEEL